MESWQSVSSLYQSELAMSIESRTAAIAKNFRLLEYKVGRWDCSSEYGAIAGGNQGKRNLVAADNSIRGVRGNFD